MYLTLNNGSASYGYPVFYPDGEVEFVSLIGGRFPDRDAVPIYPKEWFLPLIIHEYIVRACTIIYLEHHGDKRAARRNIEYDLMGGFTEIRDLVRLLDDYESQKDRYPDIKSFLPQIKIFFKDYLNDQ